MKLFPLFLASLLLLPLLYAQEEVPIGLQKIIAYNTQEASRAATNLSLFIAFVAGALTFLSPCVLPLLPAYFAYTFKERKNITLMTFIFFSGFALVFMGFDIAAGLIGETSLTALQAPTLVGILSIAALLGDFFLAVLLMIFYALGIFVPLVVVSMFYDKFRKASSRTRTVRLGKFATPLSSFIAGGILILLGLVFVIKKNTAFVNGLDPFGTKNYFYSLQRYLFDHPATTWIGMIAFFAFVISLYLFFRGSSREASA